MTKKYFLEILATSCLLFMVCAPLSSQKIYQEKIFVHTDRSMYHAGELMWMKVYVAEAATSKPTQLSRIVYLQLVDSSGLPVSQCVLNLKNGRGSGEMEIPGNLRSSVYTIVAFTRWMKNFAPASYLSRPVAVINGYGPATIVSDRNSSSAVESSGLHISLSHDSNTFGCRNPVNLRIITTDDSGAPLAANLSISVHLVDTTSFPPRQNIADEFNKTPVPASFTGSYAPEFRGQWIKGIVYNRNNNPAKNVPLYLVVPGYAAGFYNSHTDSTGRFSIQLNENITADSALLLTNPLTDSGYVIQVDNPFSAMPVTSTSRNSVAAPNNSQVEVARNVAEIRGGFNLPSSSREYSILYDTTPFYGNHDLAYALDDYTRFPKMEEVFREYVRFVTVHRRGKRFHLNVYNDAYASMFDSDPLVLIDGYPVFDINRLFEFDPLKVQHVQVLTRRFFRGSSVFDGIVNLVTYTRNLNSFETVKNAIVLKREIAQPPRKFISPFYINEITRKSRMPDFRALLHWQPEVDTDSAGNALVNFYTSDLTGTYLIEVNGQTSDGKHGSVRKLIHVKRQR